MQHIKQENAQQMNYPTHKKFNALSDNRNKLGTLSSFSIRLGGRLICAGKLITNCLILKITTVLGKRTLHFCL